VPFSSVEKENQSRAKEKFMKTRIIGFGIVVGLLLASILTACGPASATSQPTPVPATPTEAEPPTSAANPTNTPASEPGAGQPADENVLTTPSGLGYVEIEKGDGPAPQTGDVVAVHYTGTLEDGTEFDSSYGRGEPFAFPLGQGFVIPGWDEGIALMNVGGKARLIIPPELGYGDAGAGGVIPPGATLIFDVELVDILPGAPGAPAEVDKADYITTDSGLKYYDFVVGDGPSPQTGQQVLVHYTGWLQDGTKFDSSLDRGQPLGLVVGVGQVIPGWDEGLSTMKVGGKRQLVIPPELGYGEQGAGGVIPPNATLIFDVELIDVQ
jgi:peptidylprolyl isomerase